MFTYRGRTPASDAVSIVLSRPLSNDPRFNYCINHNINNILKGIDLRHKFEIALTDSHAAKISVDLAKQLLMEKFKIKWSNDVMSQNKLDVYRLVKQNFCAENYVKLNFKKQIRSVITQLRAGCLPIEIELGRYQNIPRDQRLCKQCTHNHIENELHFIFHCPKFDQIRHDLFSSLNATCGPNASDAEKIKCLFTSNLFVKTGKFIIDALKVRST